jgi:endonuclease/exonuclease/phosphatase family metal-dependent hydrolase
MVHNGGMRATRSSLIVIVWLVVAGCSSPAASPLTLLTLNIANGAGAVYRTPENRARQASFVANSGASIVGLEEVDVGVDRSDHADTGREVLALDCTVAMPEYSPDGLRRCDGSDGTYLFAIAIRGDDTYQVVNGQPIGIEYGSGTDRSHDAVVGVALGVRSSKVLDSYSVIVPTQVDQPTNEPLFAELATSGPDSPARATLADRNTSLRMLPALDPRVALVTRIDRPGAPPLTVIETHLEIAEFADLSATQLASVLNLARAERSGPPARRIVLMGDFNQATTGREQDLLDAGLRRALDPPGTVGDVDDQIWVDTDLLLLDAAEVPTMEITDHPVAVRATIQ